MTAPERLSDTAPWRDWFEKAMNSGAPIVDNASTRLYHLGELEADWETCPDCNGDGVRTVSRPHPFGFLDEDIDVDCESCNGDGRVAAA